MTTILWISIGTTIGIISPWIIMRRRRAVIDSSDEATVVRRQFKESGSRKKSKAADKERNGESYRSVTIQMCLESCAAAAKLQGQRFLASEAPELPLFSCDAEKCTCRYRHHQDRRGSEDRRFKLGQFNDINSKLGAEERREGDDGDRRRSKVRAEPAAYFNNY